MYLSHPVRRMREDPIDGESVVLIVTAEDDQQAVESALEGTSATVTDRLQFGALRVETEQQRLDEICAVEGIESIETEHAVGVGGDAGEDV